MSKSGKVPHTKANIPHESDKKFSTDEKTNIHVKDNKKSSLHTHGLKGKSSTRSPSNKKF